MTAPDKQSSEYFLFKASLSYEEPNLIILKLLSLKVSARVKSISTVEVFGETIKNFSGGGV